MMYIVTNYHLKPLSPHIRHTAFVRKLLFFLVNICVFCNLSAQTLPLSGTILDEKEEYVYAPRGLLLVYEMRKRAGFLREKKISKEEKMRIMEKEVWSVSTDKSRTIIVSVC